MTMDLAKRTFTIVCVFACIIPVFGTIDPATDRPVVNTTKGQVTGWYLESKATEGKYMSAFKGIPFAKPPVNELRFLDPVEVEEWTGTKDLPLSDPDPCAQMSSIFANKSTNEDCLFVNVYTPQDTTSNSQLPVMVWIYGGGFTVGSTNSLFYGSDFLVDQDIVFVSISYRLGALGFLNLGTKEVPGNAGLKDQLLALQWVQKEIRNFGGDPTKVTLFGESAGAASVVLLYLSPKTENLFRYAIAESGNPLVSWSFFESGFIEKATVFSQRLNCSLANNSFNLNCLQSAKVEDIIANQEIQQSNDTINVNGFTFVPSLEKSSDVALLSDTPANLLTSLVNSGRTKRPILTGINKDEGVSLIRDDPNYYALFYSKLQNFISENIRQEKTEAQIAEDVVAIQTLYFNNTEPSLSNLRGYIDFCTDQYFGLSTASFARSLAANTIVYLYRFEFSGDYNLPYPDQAQLNLTNVAIHGDELGYIFSRIGVNQSSAVVGTPSKTTLKRMVKLWTNFAKYGNPTPDGTTDDTLEKFIWSPCSDGSYRYARISEHLNMSTDDFEQEAVKLWNSFSFGTSTSSSFALLSCVLLLGIFL